jgi:hypothetical protein
VNEQDQKPLPHATETILSPSPASAFKLDRPEGHLPFIARCFLATTQLWSRINTWVEALNAGIWMGLLNRNGLNALDAWYYHRARGYMSDRHNMSGLAPWEAHIIEKYFSSSHRVLVLAAGGRREVLALARLGFEVEAWECNSRLAESATDFMRRCGYEVRVRHYDRDSLPAITATFDAIVFGWGGYMLVQECQRRVALLKALRSATSLGSPILLSFFSVRQKKSWVDSGSGNLPSE